MNIFARLRLVRSLLVAGVVLRAVGWGALAVASLLIGAALVDVVNPLTVATRSAVLGVAIAGGLAITATLLWRDRRVSSLEHVALWVEERFPSLEFTLATANAANLEDLVVLLHYAITP